MEMGAGGGRKGRMKRQVEGEGERGSEGGYFGVSGGGRVGEGGGRGEEGVKRWGG